MKKTDEEIYQRFIEYIPSTGSGQMIAAKTRL